MIRSLMILVAVTVAAPVLAAPLEYFLPGDTEYDASVPTPASVIGHEVGEWHITHDRLVQYMRVLSETSDRVLWREIGRTHEGRPLLLLAISSPENLARLEEIRERHLAFSDPRRDAPSTDDMPAVVWMGYSVHGNEPSGSNAAPVVAYHLAAAQDAWTRALLDDTVILFDPSVNPDGLQRFAHWANSHRGMTLVADPQSREHDEGWPSGRGNHYWFDLNRDWLLLVHPESRARVAEFHRWRPNVLTDHHEMGTNQTFFFQPGIETRQNPLLPPQTLALTRRIAEYHAAALDAAGSLYYSGESFDDFYLGKGSTYPDIHGSIGILFEQASSRGHLQESENGDVAFPFTIRNQVLTSFSTLRAAHALRVDLLRWQREFAETALADGRRHAARGWVFGDDGDPARAQRLVEILTLHGIEVHPLARDLEVDGHAYRQGSAWVVPAGQPQYRLAQGVFERRTEFTDKTFYDVSSWTLPLAFGLPFAELGRRYDNRLHGTAAPTARGAARTEGAVAYAFEWGSYFAPRAAYRLLDAGLQVRVATAPFGDFAAGTVVVPVTLQGETERAALDALLTTIEQEDGVRVHALTTGLTARGVDLGSPSLESLILPRVALIVGGGVSSTEAGEAWHLLDERFGMPVTLLETDAVERADLSRYTHIVLVNGRHDDLSADAIGAWVRAGGVLVASKGGARWAVEHDLVEAEFASREDAEPATERRDYADAQLDRELQLLSGAIFETDLDITHPLGWGISRRALPMFRNWTQFLQAPADDPYATVARYTDAPLLAGYVSEENLTALAGSAAVVALQAGEGVVVLSAENLLFRGYWYGTSRVFLNALYFGRLIR